MIVIDEPIKDMMSYRFKTSSDLNGHALGNILLTGANEVTGNVSDGIELLNSFIRLKGNVMPLTEDNVTLMAKLEDGTIIEGEHNITSRKEVSKIKKLYYKEDAVATKEALIIKSFALPG